MTNVSAKQAKHVLVWLHIIASVGWCAAAITQLTLIGISLHTNKDARVVLLNTTLTLENGILDPFGIAAIYTGVMLSALTPWGFFRHWWVAVKFWLTIAAILLGSIFLGRWLEDAVESVRTGDEWSAGPLVAGTSSTLAALLLMIWLSVAKPWGRRATTPKRPEQTDGRLLLAAAAVPIAEYLIGLDYPVLTFGTAVGYAVYRTASSQRRQGRPHTR